MEHRDRYETTFDWAAVIEESRTRRRARRRKRLYRALITTLALAWVAMAALFAYDRITAQQQTKESTAINTNR